jgi:hypothetical protein
MCAATDTVLASSHCLTSQPLADTGLTDSSSKVQVSAVNMLNLALSQPESAAVLGPLLEAEQGTVLAALSGLLDHSLALLRAKALVTIMLLRRCACAGGGGHWRVPAGGAGTALSVTPRRGQSAEGGIAPEPEGVHAGLPGVQGSQ